MGHSFQIALTFGCNRLFHLKPFALFCQGTVRRPLDCRYISYEFALCGRNTTNVNRQRFCGNGMSKTLGLLEMSLTEGRTCASDGTGQEHQGRTIDWRLWTLLAVSLLARLPCLTSPLLDAHAWRQTATASIARNYAENGFRFLSPQVDVGGDGPGYVGCELPLYPFMVALAYAVTGVREWMARWMAMLCAVCATAVLYALAREVVAPPGAFCAALCFAVQPMGVFFTRNVQPEALMLLLSMLCVWMLGRWKVSGSPRQLKAAALFLGLAIGVKLTCAHLLLPCFYLLVHHFGKRFWKEPQVWTFGVIALTIPMLWCVHAYRLASMTGIAFNLSGQGAFASWRDWLSGQMWTELLVRFAFVVLSPVVLLITGLAVIASLRERQMRFFHVWLVAVLIYVAATAPMSKVHYYYYLPLLPIASIFFGKGLTHIRGRFASRLTIAAATASLAVPLFWVVPWYRVDDAFLKAASELHRIAPRSALVLAADTGEPELLYYAHRKGWHLRPQQWSVERLKQYHASGARFLVVTHPQAFQWDDATRDYLRDYAVQRVVTEAYWIYELCGKQVGLSPSSKLDMRESHVAFPVGKRSTAPLDMGVRA